MPPTPDPLWPGYGDDGERSLIELLNAKIAATQDDDDPTDERATRDFAAAIESHEWLRRGSQTTSRTCRSTPATSASRPTPGHGAGGRRRPHVQRRAVAGAA